MSRYRTIDIWNRYYKNLENVYDYAGRLMKKSACNNPNSKYFPTIDHVRPLSKGGSDVIENIILCNRKTNEVKADNFPHWKTNGNRFFSSRIKGNRKSYAINKY